MALPLPRVVADVGPGGPLVTAMGGMNALQKAMLENKYYGPNIQSEINNRNALTEGQNITNQYLPDKLRLANAFAQLHNQYYGPNIQSEINNRNALTNKYNTMTPLEAKELELKNQFYPQLTRSQIDSAKALANIRKFGGGGVGVGGKEELLFQNLVGRDNPGLSPDQVYEASNVLREGGNRLADGTIIKPLSQAAKSSLNRLAKYDTTAPLITGNIKGAQAEAEIDALAKHAQEGLRPYGNTYLGYSPAQIIDSFKSDDKSQDRLGKFIASKQLQYEIAQNQIRLANGQPGVTSTQELMNLGMQNIKSAFPKLSAHAREAAQNYFIEGLKKGFQERKKINLGASNAQGSSNPSPHEGKADYRYNPETGDLEKME